MCKAKGYAKRFSNLYQDLKGEYSSLVEENKISDAMIQDLLHSIEFENFNVVQGYKLAKQIKDIRIQRRELKNEFEAMQSLYSFIQPMINKIEQADKRVDKILETQKRRIYTPRILK